MTYHMSKKGREVQELRVESQAQISALAFREYKKLLIRPNNAASNSFFLARPDLIKLGGKTLS